MIREGYLNCLIVTEMEQEDFLGWPVETNGLSEGSPLLLADKISKGMQDKNGIKMFSRKKEMPLKKTIVCGIPFAVACKAVPFALRPLNPVIM